MSNLRIDRRRELLLEAGERVIARVGLEGATIRAIVGEAGMSLASFHYAFTSREDFIRRLIERHLVPRVVPLPEGGTFREALTSFLETLAAGDASDGEVTATLALHALLHDGLREIVLERTAADDARLTLELTALAEGHGMTWAVEPQRLAKQLNAWRFGSAVRGALLRRGTTSAEQEPEQGEPEHEEGQAPAERDASAEGDPPTAVTACVTMLLALSRPLTVIRPPAPTTTPEPGTTPAAAPDGPDVR